MVSYADVGCVLKVNVQCEACKMKLHEVLSSISGVYSVTIDAEEGLAKISGEMDPNVLLWALARNGKHAELKWVKLKSPAPKKGHYNEGYGGSYGYGYGAMDNPYRGKMPISSEGVRHNTHHQSYCPQRRPMSDQHYGNMQQSNGGYYAYDDPFRRPNMM